MVEGQDARDLGTLAPGDPAASSEADAINDAGQVVGWSNTNFGDLAAHAFLWSAGKLTDLGTLGSNDLESTAYDINTSGEVVGSSDIGGGEHRHAFLWTNGKMSDLGTLGAYSESGAGAINDSSQIVGTSYTRSSGKITTERAFLWSSGTMTDLGTLGGKSSFAADINRSGQVVGQSQTSSGHWHAFLWSRGKMTDLGTLGARSGSASGVNTSGDIVGAIQWDAKGRDVHAVLWTAANKVGRTTVPNLRGMTLAAAHDAIARAECSFGHLRHAYAGRVRAGRVMSQSPRADTKVVWGERVSLVISRSRRG